jgi:hypothetical protein
MSDLQTDTGAAIDSLGGAIDATQNRAANLAETNEGEVGPKTYSGTVEGLREAGREIVRRRQEAEASGPTSDDVAAADAEHHRRVAERMGVPGVDLNKIVLTKPDEPLTARNAGKLLADYKASREAELASIVDEKQYEKEWSALQEQQQAAEAPQPVEQPAAPTPDLAEQMRAAVQAEWRLANAARQLTQAEMRTAAAQQEAIDEHIRHFGQKWHPNEVWQIPADKQAAYHASLGRIQQLSAAVGQLDSERQLREHQAAQLQRAANYESLRQRAAETSRVIEAETPELKDPRQAAEFKAAAARTMKEIMGIDVGDFHKLHPAWQHGMYTPEFQRLVAEATRFRLMQEARKDLNAHRVVPPVQRPGVSGQVNNSGRPSAGQLAKLRSMSGTQGVKYAARLLRGRG